MKGKISERLECVLRDPKGREQLNQHLLNGKDGNIQAGGKTYTLRTDVRTDATGHRKEK
jgi:hypothetical protein